MEKRIAYPSVKQKEFLIELMKKQPELVSGRFSHGFTRKDAQKKWEDTAKILNGIPGARKDWNQWKKVSNP